MQSSSPVVVVVHGSRNRGWVGAQRSWFEGVRRRLPASTDVRLTFLELTEPLLETELRDLAGRVKSVCILPFFLSKSGHVAEEIPEIATAALGDTPWEMLEPEGLDDVLGRNAERRLTACGADPTAPVIVSGYGASAHGDNWLSLVERVRSRSGAWAKVPWHFAPAGHFLTDASEPLRQQLRRVAADGGRAAVLPLFLAVSDYQYELIPRVLREFPDLHIAFAPDAVLPDPSLEEWGAQRILKRSTE